MISLYLTIALLVFCTAALVAFCLASKRGEARAIKIYGTNTDALRGSGAPGAADAGGSSQPEIVVQARSGRTRLERGMNTESTGPDQHRSGANFLPTLANANPRFLL